MNISQIIESIIMLMAGLLMGVVAPIGIVQLVNYLDGSNSIDPSKSFVILFILAAVAPSLGAAAIRKVREDRHAWWIAPTIGFNITFAFYIVLAATWVPSETWNFVLLTYAVMLIIAIMTFVPELLPPVRKRPGIISDED